MKLIIIMPEEIYTDVKENYQGNDVLYSAVKYGAPVNFCKYRTKDYVFYNVDWLKERWEMEMKLLGVDFSKHDEEIIRETVESIWGKPPYTEVIDKIATELKDLIKTVDDMGCSTKQFRVALGIVNQYRKGQTDADSD